MPKTIEVLVSYDIEDNKTRTSVCNRLKDAGMISIQKSVMWGKLLPADINLITRILKLELEKTDKAFLLKCSLSSDGKFFGDIPDFKGYDDHAIF
jgi:CRISPR-associated protein Cas2